MQPSLRYRKSASHCAEADKLWQGNDHCECPRAAAATSIHECRRPSFTSATDSNNLDCSIARAKAMTFDGRTAIKEEHAQDEGDNAGDDGKVMMVW